jgi:MFS family permease
MSTKNNYKIYEKSSDVSSNSSTPHEEVILKEKKVTKKMFMIEYTMVILTYLVEQLSQDSTSELSSYATSFFNAHSMISTAQIVYKITAVCAYPILGKVADLLGRGEGFGLTVMMYTLAFVLFAARNTVGTYIAGQILCDIGRVGFKTYVLIFTADTTNLINRGLWSQLPSAITGIPALYAGSYIQYAFLKHSPGDGHTGHLLS